jgi:hypothetical protein
MSGYSVKVKNDSNKKLVAFKRAPSASTLISGVPSGGGEHGLKKDAALFATTGDFVLFLVSEEDYLANKDNLSTLASRPFTRIYAYFNANAENKLTYTISSILGGSKKIVLQNSTSYNIELRKDGVQGELIGYTGQGSYNTTFNVEPGTYMVFPVFRKFNQSRGEIITVYPKYQGGNLDGKAKFEYFSLDDSLDEATLNASSYLGSDFVLKTGSAYLVIQNNHGTGMGLWDGYQQVTTSTGGQAINPNNSLTFQIDMSKKPGSNDEYLDTSVKAQFKVSTPAYSVSVPEFAFENDKIYSLAADGYKIKTPAFNLSIRLPGEYEGAETSLPEGVHPEARLQASASLRKYIQERVQAEFDGVDQRDGLIAEAVDEHTGQIDEIMTIGNLLTIRGYGLKIEAEAKYADQAGPFFDGGENPPVKAEILAVNEPRTLKAIVPASLAAGKDYTLKVVTQSSVKHGVTLLKNLREVRSEFILTAQNQ